MLRLMIVEANRVAAELNLEEQLPITKTNLTLISLVPAGKTWATLGVIDTRNYAYSMDVKDFGVVVSGITRKGYQDFHEARAKYVWPVGRNDSNRTFQTTKELIGRVGFDFAGLNRDCRVRIDFPEERGLFSHTFSPIYTVSWFLKTNTVLVDSNQIVGSIEFIEPLKCIRQVGLTDLLPDSRYNMRRPVERVDFITLLTPENTREVVLNEVEMATNYVTRIEDLRRGGLPESELRRVWRDYTNAPFPTNVLAAPKSE